MANGVVQITDPSIQVRDVSTRKIGRFISRVAFVATLSAAMPAAGAIMAEPFSDLPDAGTLTPTATVEGFYNNKLLAFERVTVGPGATHITWRITPIDAIDHFGDLINRSLLVPSGAVTLARENGAIESRLKEIATTSGTTVASASCGTKSVPDGGSSVALMTIGLGILATLKRIFLS